MLILKVYVTLSAISILTGLSLMILNTMKITKDDSFLGNYNFITSLVIIPILMFVVIVAAAGLYVMWIS